MTFIIAEAGINHMGNFTKALQMVDVAKDAGADCVKFQIYHSDAMLKGNKEYLKKFEFTLKQHGEIARYCKHIGIDWMASCFDIEAVDLAVSLGAKFIKVGSGEIDNLPMLRHLGGQRVILSTGMCEGWEVQRAIYNLEYAKSVTLLHCVSIYPTPLKDCNVRAIERMRGQFGLPVGYSDHSIGFDAAVCAVALGATVIEKHFMLDPNCPDVAVSLSPSNLAGYVHTIRRTEEMLGDGVKRLMPGESEMKEKCRGRWYG